MGGGASRAVAKRAVRPLKNINVENRAQKAIEKHQTDPVAAPRHPTSEERIEKLISDHPEIKEEIERQDESLIHRINRLQLEVIDELPKIQHKDRPLPQSREPNLDPLQAVEDPKKVPVGKVSLRQVGRILQQHRLDPSKYGAEDVASEYKLDRKQAEYLLKYFKKFNIQDFVGKDQANTESDLSFKIDLDKIRFDDYKKSR